MTATLIRTLTATLTLLLILAAPAAEPVHVILISIDGLAAYHLDNPDHVLPNIRELIRDGVRAESSETVFPSVTHPSHTTLLTGVSPRVHGVVGNRVRNRVTGESFHITNRPRRESVTAPTIFDAARAKGLRTAAFFWPETREDPSIDHNLAELLDEAGNAEIRGVDTAFLEELRAGGVPIDLYYRWYARGPSTKGAADMVLAEAAAYVLRRHKPHLLAIHFLVTDSTQHTYGPEHALSAAALTAADACVGTLREAARDAGISDRTVFLVVADHGFHTVRFEVNLDPLFRRSGLLDRLRLHPEGWSLWVERTAGFQAPSDEEKLQSVLSAAGRLEGVARVIGPEDLHGLGLPTYDESPYIRGQYAILGDIDTYLVADPAGTSTERRLRARPAHSHGYLPSHPRMYPALVLSGYGVRRGVTIGHVRNHDVAPTISRLLGLEMKGFEGRVLTEALADP